MRISSYSEYLVSNREAFQSNKFISIVVAGDSLQHVVSPLTAHISEVHTYEIYTCDPLTGQTGWEIEHVRSTDDLIKSFPQFDCIITRNDSAYAQCIDFLDLNNRK